jgi:hypothetical protein
MRKQKLQLANVSPTLKVFCNAPSLGYFLLDERKTNIKMSIGFIIITNQVGTKI